MAIQYTPALSLPYPEVTDAPLIASRDLRALAQKMDSEGAQIKGESVSALTAAQAAEALAGQAMARAEKVEFPIVSGTTPPEDTRMLWVDTSTLDPDEPGVPPEPDPDPEPNGVGYVGDLAEQSPYTSLAVRGVDDDGAVVSYDITASGGGKSVTTRVQGRYVEGTAYIDGYQRIEEITLGGGYQAGPRSNMEWATQFFASTEATSGAQFSPYHGSTTALAWQTSPSTYTTLSGASVAMPGENSTVQLPDGLAITQTVRAAHPDYSGTGDQIEVTTTTSFHPDGMVEVQGTWKALVGMKVNAVYAPMVPFQRDDITALDHAGGTVTVDNSAPSGTTNQTLPDIDTGVFRSASRPDLRIAWAFTNPDETLRRGEADRKTVGDILFIQRRTDGINKLYHHVWDPGTVVSAGTTYNFGAQWRYMEVA